MVSMRGREQRRYSTNTETAFATSNPIRKTCAKATSSSIIATALPICDTCPVRTQKQHFVLVKAVVERLVSSRVYSDDKRMRTTSVGTAQQRVAEHVDKSTVPAPAGKSHKTWHMRQVETTSTERTAHCTTLQSHSAVLDMQQIQQLRTRHGTICGTQNVSEDDVRGLGKPMIVPPS